MLRTLLIDDEIEATNALEHELVQNFPQIKIVEKCNSSLSGLENIYRYKPDLVFLDIDMPSMNGFELLQKFDEIFFNVIFCTGHRKYAIDAFRISAVVDYLTKPIKINELKDAISRVQKKLNPGMSQLQFNTLLQNLQGPTKLTLNSNTGMDFIPIKDIVYCKSDGNMISIYLLEKEKPLVYTKYTMKAIQERLPDDMFGRASQSYLINLNHIQNFNKGQQLVEMSNGKIISVSRAGKIQLTYKIEKLTNTFI